MLPALSYRLVIIQGPDAGQGFEIQETEVVIGRAPEVQVVVNSPAVSRSHARIYTQFGRHYIEDLGSANGTFLNSERLMTSQPLASGDQIMLGDSVQLEYQPIQTGPAPKETIVLREEEPEAFVPRTVIPGPQVRPEQQVSSMLAGPNIATTRAYDEAAELGSAPEIPPKLIVTVAGESPQTYTLTAAQLSLGREPDNDIIIGSKIVSRHHALLEKTLSSYRLVLLSGNTNETAVDGELVSESVELKQNSLIRVGSGQAGQLVTMQYIQSARSEPRGARNIQLGTQTKLLVGRDPGNDIILEAPAISRFHAEIERVGQRYRIKDLRSLNGTFVNNLRIDGETWAKPQDSVRIGPYLFVLGEDEMAQIDQTGGLHVDAVGLQKWVRKDLNLLQDISLSLKPREFVVVVGQSGGGKTTLVDALAGYRPATHGHVFINDIDLYRHFDAVRSNIGYVPQRDIIHMELTVYQSLDYAAKLRMPPDTTPEERRTRIMEVLQDLDLVHRKDVQISGLSGGQQKRVSIGVELLTKPGLFFLDEPTSGLDPGTETSLMQLMRRLADQGRTIILITHATKNVMLADKVIFLARGGYVAWVGPPDEALTYFSKFQSERERRYFGMDFDQIYAILDDTSKGTPEEWDQRFRANPAFQQYILEPLRGRGHAPEGLEMGGRQPGVVKRTAGAVRSRQGSRGFKPIQDFRQFLILSARNLKILSRDRISLFLMLAAAPLVGMLDFVLAGGSESDPYEYMSGDFSSVAISLFLFSIYGVMVGALSQMREIVKEKAVYRRERLVNLQIIPYVMSKMWVAALLALYHAIAYTVLHYLAFNMPGGVLEFGLIWITVVLATFAGMMIGLFASALAPNSNTVPMLVILLIIPQIVLGGALIPLPSTVTAITSTRWAFQSFMGIAGVGSDLAADPCWQMPDDQRAFMTLEEKDQLGCLCMGVNVLRQDSCDFPALGELYTPEIDEPGPSEPEEIGGLPEKPSLPDPPAEPANLNDPIALNAYLQELKQHQAKVAEIQTEYEGRVQAYQTRVEEYQGAMVTYQQDLADWQIKRTQAIGQAEAMLARFERIFGWSTVDKEDEGKFSGMLVKTWMAQLIIISILFMLIIIMMRTKDRQK